MKHIIATAAMFFCINGAIAQQKQFTTPHLYKLLADGYEVKAMTIQGTAGIFFMQKGESAYFCLTEEIGGLAYWGVNIGMAQCSPIRANSQ
jgi:hypothetical protein